MKDYFYGAIKGFIEAGFSVWNACIKSVLLLLSQGPEEFGDGSLWNSIKSIEPIFVGVGTGLIVLFFAIGFCQECVDVKSEMRFEVILRFLLRLSIAEFLVVQNLSILQAIFTSIGNLGKLVIGTMKTEDGMILKIPSEQIDYLKSLKAFGLLPLILLAVVVMLVVACAGFMLLYTIYFRLFKVLIIMPYGALAFSTVAGNNRVSNVSGSFARYAISTSLEAVTIILALFLGIKFINGGVLPDFLGEDPSGTLAFTVWCLQTCFVSLLTVGIVKGAQNITSKALGI